VVEPWWNYARTHYLDLAGADAPTSTTLYYDPILDMHHRLPVAAALTTSFYAAPQFDADARRLFEAAHQSMGLGAEPMVPLRPGRGVGSALILAKEWKMLELTERLTAAIDVSFEPTWDHDGGEFTWGMGLDEPHPRGQFNAFLGAADAAGPGMWNRLSAAPLEPCPQIVDVDFPNMAFTRAEWIDGNLHLRLAPLREDPDAKTYFRIVGAEPRNWEVHGLDGFRLELTMSGLNVTAPMMAGDVAFIRSSY